MKSNLYTIIITITTTVWLAVACDAELLRNPGLEEPYEAIYGNTNSKSNITGFIASGWEDNSAWANVSIRYEKDTSNTHSGKAAQKVEVIEVRSGRAQFAQKVALKKDALYKVSLWLKGTPSKYVMAILRKREAPYTAYGTRLIPLMSEWQHTTFACRVSEDVDGYLMLTANTPMTFWVDDVSLTDVSNAESDSPPFIGNLLPNGSFETGLSAGWSARIRGIRNFITSSHLEYSDPRAVIDNTTASDGKKCIRADIPKDMGLILSSSLVQYNYGRNHCASVALKSDRAGVPVSLELEGTSISKIVNVDTDWKRYSITGRIPYGTHTRFVIKCVADNTKIYIDAAMLEEANSPTNNYIPASPIELALDIPNPGHIFYDDENVEVNVETSGELPNNSKLRVSITDLDDKTIKLPTIQLPCSKITLPPWIKKRGVYKITAQVVGADGTKLSTPVQCIFARLPRPRNISPEESFFGIHIPLNPYFIQLAKSLGMRWVRLHDASMITKWAVVQAEPDAGFSYFDIPVKATRKAGLQILGMLDGAPAWASNSPRATTGYFALYNFPDIQNAHLKWEEYVRNMVRHYKGMIDYWEVWNEPWGDSFFPVPSKQYGEEYGKLLKIAYKSAKEENPKSIILGIGTSPAHDEYTSKAMKSSGGSKSFDIFAFHEYNPELYGGPNNTSQRNVNEFISYQKEYGDIKPIWNTEGGPENVESFYHPNGMGLSPRMQVSYIIRADVTMMHAGIKKFFYYTLHGAPSYGFTSTIAVEHDRAIRPIMAARAVLASLVDGAKCIGYKELEPGVDAYTFQHKNKSKITVLWSNDGKAHEIPIPPNAHVLDALSNPIDSKQKITVTHEPIYFVE